MYLDTTSKVLQVILASAKTTNDCEITADYIDTQAGTTFGPGNSLVHSNGTSAVSVVGSPAASTQRKISAFTFYNADTVNTTITVRIYDGTNTWRAGVTTLTPGQTLVYTPEAGWNVLSGTGIQVENTGFSPQNAKTALMGPTTGSPTIPTFRQPETSDLSDVSSGAWVAVDGSGAGLTFSSVNCAYMQIGDIIFASAYLTFPSTINTSSAIIGGLPFVAANPTYNLAPSPVSQSGTIAFPLITIVNRGSITTGLYNQFNQSGVTNAQLSGQTIFFNLQYYHV